MQSLEVEPQIKLVKEVVKTITSKVDTKPLVVIQVEAIEIVVEQP
jgi:hypothetical protein